MVPVECTEQTDRHRKAGLAFVVVPDRSGALRFGPFEVVPDGDAEVLAAYRKVYGRADRVIVHFAGCGRCTPEGRPPAGNLDCEDYIAAYRVDYQALQAGSRRLP